MQGLVRHYFEDDVAVQARRAADVAQEEEPLAENRPESGAEEQERCARDQASPAGGELRAGVTGSSVGHRRLPGVSSEAPVFGLDWVKGRCERRFSATTIA
ncbi:hypothetical protein GCM10010269_34440 [Streptomyces humidus]|uniref:Uncharacterized protein n=1 Tax=Streptomyces humidus TaxID=52259 RepID=A0A918FWE8_9ACTN|nr:hypothetical protein GCM10010269_34440 [Streptomyces humidus]